MMPQSLDHNNFTYLAVTLSPSTSPSSLSAGPHLTHIGQVGQLQDVQLFSVPKLEWQNHGDDILKDIGERDGVLRVDVQVPERRAKRGDEL
ncbi:hypothetical protein BDQ12DRAFT_692303 [Crucibulum laeve]|uniref:Uncharacterized protein n=1 Tax=Crucibulum laeve TaxID=68775 RepID=A0A5C3LIZ6_9AGAR|nr:hypothetical protein BDQ12DRAFT_692303 [Crucibulum laeve]